MPFNSDVSPGSFNFQIGSGSCDDLPLFEQALPFHLMMKVLMGLTLSLTLMSRVVRMNRDLMHCNDETSPTGDEYSNYCQEPNLEKERINKLLTNKNL